MFTGRLVIWLSGAQRDILRKSPADYPRYFGMGFVVLITASIATLSMAFALHTALKVELVAAIVFALLWGIAVMNIDRWLVVSLQRQEGKLAYISVVTIRLALGLLFGLVISTPFVLQIFKPEIDKQITIIQRNGADAYFSQLKTSPLSQKITADQQAVSATEATIRSRGGAGPDPSKDATVIRLTAQRNQARHQTQADYRQWQCQLYGIPKGQCKPGQGPLAAASHQRYVNDLAQVSQLSTRISGREQQLIDQANRGRGSALQEARTALPGQLGQLRRDQDEQAGLTKSFTQQNASNAGLLLRLKALDQATAGNGALSTARWLLLALFTVIEWLPVLVKTLLNLGPKTKYEELAELDQIKRWRTSREETKRQQVAEIIGAESIITEAENLAGERESYLPGIREQIIAAERRVAEELVRDWEARERRAIRQESLWQRIHRGLFQRDSFRRESTFNVTSK